MNAEIEADKKIRPNWICFSCGRKCKSRRSLYAHLQHCYWYSQFKDHIEDAPFYRRIPSKQLRYYYNHRPDLLARRKKLRKEQKEPGGLGVRGLKIGTAPAHLPKSLRNR
jgi:hypothetical protein